MKTFKLKILLFVTALMLASSYRADAQGASIVHDPTAFWENLRQFGENLKISAQQIGITEESLNMITNSKDMLEGVYKTSRTIGKYMNIAQDANDVIQALEDIYRSGERAYRTVNTMVQNGDITYQEALQMTDCIGTALYNIGNRGEFLTKMFQGDHFTSAEFLNQCKELLIRIKESQRRMWGMFAKKNYDNAKKKEDHEVDVMIQEGTGVQINNPGLPDNLSVMNGDERPSKAEIKEKAKQELGDDRNTIIKNLTPDQIAKIADEANLVKNPEKLIETTFTNAFWESFGNFLYAVYGLILMLYIAWAFIKKEHGNPQNQDSMRKVIYGFIFGALLLVLFNNVIVPNFGTAL